MTSLERHVQRRARREVERLLKKLKHFDKCIKFDDVFTKDHLYKSYKLTKRNVGWKASTQKYTIFAAAHIIKTYEELKEKTFHRDKFFEFDLIERGKLRHIRSVTIRERVVQRCLCDYCLVPLLSNSFIYDNTASLKGKGYTFARERATEHLRQFYREYGIDGYILLFDFHSYFDSIPHDLLKKIINNLYIDDDLKALTWHFVEAFGDKGLGLGSQVSQILALAAANPLDHFIKEVLGIKFYARYMDDGYLMHPSKEFLQTCLEKIKKVCDSLGLELNLKKTQIIPITHFTFLKTRFSLLQSGKIVRKIYKKSTLRMRKKLKKLKNLLSVKAKLTIDDIYAGFQSWKSYAYHFNAYNTIVNMCNLFIELFSNVPGGNKYDYKKLLYNKT